ncbi:MAG: T9SS type A sorting domain-containing protein [bacterium]
MKAKTVLTILFSLLTIITVFFQFFSQPRVKEISAHRTSGAMEALDFWYAQRAYPDKTIPDVGHYAAYEYSRRNLRSRLNKSSMIEPWKAIGPHNIGGRTLAIVFNPLNPNTIYAGSASGGLWRSYTGGRGAQAWEYVSTGFPVLAVSSIAIAPDDSNTIYIGTGEVYNFQNTGTGFTIRPTRGVYGIGILKTTDGGKTWTKSLDWSSNQKRGVWAVRMNPQNPNTIWAGTTEGTYKSTDAGDTWVRVDPTIMVMDLVINPIDTNMIFITAGDLFSPGHGIYRTKDGGATWTKLTQGLPNPFGGKAMLSICQSFPNIIFASIGNGISSNDAATWLCKSEDNGDTWKIVSTKDYSLWQGWYSHDVGVHPNVPNLVLAIGVDIWKSTSGGLFLVKKSDWSAWFFGRTPPGGPEGPTNYSHADHHDIVYHPTNPDIIYFATDGGVFRSTDGGETFEGCNGGYQTSQFYQGFTSSRLDSLLSIGGMQDNSTAIYDGQVAWKRVIGGDGGWASIDPTNDNIMYGSAQFLQLFKSTNGGATWINISPPFTTSTSFIAPFVIGIVNPEIIYAGRSLVYKSTNGGISWTSTNWGRPLDGNPLLSFAISHQNSNVVYATTAPINTRGGIFRTTDGGQSWDNITATLPDRFPVDIAVDPTDDTFVYVAFSGFGTSHVFKSTNAGNNWQDIGQGLPDVPTSAVIVDPLFPNHIYVGNDIGVYVSTDGGNSWEEFKTGMPDAVIVLDLSISLINRKLRVATHGNGVFERKLIEGPITSVSEEVPIASEFRLKQNYPNPFNPSTTIEYTLPIKSKVELRIYNLLGQKIRTLVNQEQTAGTKTILWDSKNELGQTVSSGIYIYRMKAGHINKSRKMMFLK